MDKVIEVIKENKIIIGVLSILVVGYFVVHQMEQPTKPSEPMVSRVNQVTSEKDSKIKSSQKGNKILVIDISGAVNKPGVYRLSNGSIVQDAIQMAGGLSQGADIHQLNQAQKITDSMKIFVPEKGETPPTATASQTSSSTGGSEQKVNLNSATPDDFKNVHGIGPKKAEKIFNYRQKNGNFSKIEDLKKVGGFGDKSIESLKDSLTV